VGDLSWFHLPLRYLYPAPIGQIVHVLDPVAYAVSLLTIVGACLMAASIPAARAARLDPTQALRQE
jgi:ABC-type lipoprotein release transport system permease subunit